MIPAVTKYMLSKSFSKINFTFKPLDWPESNDRNSEFGLYLHVPFCRMFCSFVLSIKFSMTKI